MNHQKKNRYKISSQVWVYPGLASWHFISLDRKLSAEIKEKYGKNFYGSGFLKIKAFLGGSSWQTALFPYKTQNIYLLSIKKQIRQKEKVFNGDKVDIVFDLI